MTESQRQFSNKAFGGLLDLHTALSAEKRMPAKSEIAPWKNEARIILI